MEPPLDSGTYNIIVRVATSQFHSVAGYSPDVLVTYKTSILINGTENRVGVLVHHAC